MRWLSKFLNNDDLPARLKMQWSRRTGDRSGDAGAFRDESPLMGDQVGSIATNRRVRDHRWAKVRNGKPSRWLRWASLQKSRHATSTTGGKHREFGLKNCSHNGMHLFM